MSGVDVELVDVTRTVGDGERGVTVLQGVDLRLPPGSTTLVLGGSRTGKTTLLRLLAGLAVATSGRVVLDGHDVGRLEEAERLALRRETIGMVPQEVALIAELTAADNVGLPLRLLRAPVDERRGRVALLLDLVGLAPHAGQRADQLSGGQRQRVALARSMAARPRLLLADEPLGQLDRSTGVGVMENLLRQARDDGATVVLTDREDTLAPLADEVLTLDGGRLRPAVG